MGRRDKIAKLKPTLPALQIPQGVIHPVNLYGSIKNRAAGARTLGKASNMEGASSQLEYSRSSIFMSLLVVEEAASS